MKCISCGVELKNDEPCVFATHKVNAHGRDYLVCCVNCAGHDKEEKPIRKKAKKK